MQRPASETDPCWKERQLALKCLDENNYDKDKCDAHFENGKLCKKFWQAIAIDRRSKNLHPAIPIGEERDRIRAEYMKTYKKKRHYVLAE